MTTNSLRPHRDRRHPFRFIRPDRLEIALRCLYTPRREEIGRCPLTPRGSTGASFVANEKPPPLTFRRQRPQRVRRCRGIAADSRLLRGESVLQAVRKPASRASDTMLVPSWYRLRDLPIERGSESHTRPRKSLPDRRPCGRAGRIAAECAPGLHHSTPHTIPG
jgi:hypothetical protein